MFPEAASVVYGVEDVGSNIIETDSPQYSLLFEESHQPAIGGTIRAKGGYPAASEHSVAKSAQGKKSRKGVGEQENGGVEENMFEKLRALSPVVYQIVDTFLRRISPALRVTNDTSFLRCIELVFHRRRSTAPPPPKNHSTHDAPSLQ